MSNLLEGSNISPTTIHEIIEAAPAEKIYRDWLIQLSDLPEMISNLSSGRLIYGGMLAANTESLDTFRSNIYGRRKELYRILGVDKINEFTNWLYPRLFTLPMDGAVSSLTQEKARVESINEDFLWRIGLIQEVNGIEVSESSGSNFYGRYGRRKAELKVVDMGIMGFDRQEIGDEINLPSNFPNLEPKNMSLLTRDLLVNLISFKDHAELSAYANYALNPHLKTNYHISIAHGLGGSLEIISERMENLGFYESFPSRVKKQLRKSLRQIAGGFLVKPQ